MAHITFLLDIVGLNGSQECGRANGSSEGKQGPRKCQTPPMAGWEPCFWLPPQVAGIVLLY